MDNFKKGEMVRVKVLRFDVQGDPAFKIMHGIVLDVRNKTEIALVEFLPLYNRERQWTSFGIMEHMEIQNPI